MFATLKEVSEVRADIYCLTPGQSSTETGYAIEKRVLKEIQQNTPVLFPRYERSMKRSFR